MQTFSYLQRNIYDKNNLALGTAWLGLFLWGSITKLNPYLPPLFGFLLAGAMVIKNKEYVIGIFAYFLFFEADRGYFLFSTWLFFYIHIKFIMPLIASVIDCKKCLLVISVAIGYLLYYFLLFCLGAIFLEKLHIFTLFPVFVYIAIESFMIMVLE
jgi:hypothetical protein